MLQPNIRIRVVKQEREKEKKINLSRFFFSLFLAESLSDPEVCARLRRARLRRAHLRRARLRRAQNRRHVPGPRPHVGLRNSDMCGEGQATPPRRNTMRTEEPSTETAMVSSVCSPCSAPPVFSLFCPPSVLPVLPIVLCLSSWVCVF